MKTNKRKRILKMQMRVFAISLIVSFLSTQVLFVPTAYAASYTFTQSSWAGGATTATSTHTSNQSGWTELTSTSSATAGTTVTLPASTYTYTDDGATSTTASTAVIGGGFSNGTTNTTIAFTDDGATSTAPSAVAFGGGFANGTSVRIINFTDDGTTTTYPTPTTAVTGGGFANGTNSSTIVVGSNASSTVRLTTTSVLGTGGTINNVGASTTHTFSDTGSFTFVPANSGNISVLVVAGGGGGGGKSPANVGTGGGGAGGLVASSTYAVTSGQAITVTVGEGGLGGSSGAGAQGSNSVFGTITATGGGYGSIDQGNGGNGGSGGGGSHGNGGTGGTGTAGQGNSGANGASMVGGGGGGAGAAGSVGGGGSGGAGGNGSSYTISGSSVTYAGGGGGGANATSAGSAGSGGSGGGGTGAAGEITALVTQGAYNTGGGGGGASFLLLGGNGGSGIVIISYPIPTSGASSGTFTSAVIDLGTASTFSTLAYVASTTATTTPSGTSVSMDIRAGDTSDLSAVSWTTGVSNGGSISALGSHRYVQYRANLSTTNTAFTPTLESVIISYEESAANTITGSGTGASVGLAATSVTGASGGTITTSGGNTIHTFTSSGTFVSPSVANSGIFSVLVVAGGGGGGSAGNNAVAGGAGGAGGVIYKSNYFITSSSSVTVTVGAGGTGGTAANGTQGSNSVFGTVTATGGGYGSGSVAGGSGGSGGGGVGNAYDGGVGTAGQGNGGGCGTNDAFAGGGGGGARGAGACAKTAGGAGGIGYTSTISGSSVTYGGGGGGGAKSGSAGAGGSGGGGAGGVANVGTAGTANTGGGGGGSGTSSTAGGAGGSGVVIVSYPTPITDATAGAFTSAVIDTGSTDNVYTTLSFTSTTPSGSSVTMKVRSSSNSGMSGATAFSSCTAITSGAALSTGGCVTDGHRYVQYQATFVASAATPTLDSVTINYTGTATNSISGSGTSASVGLVSATSTGGTVTSSGGNWIHTFTSSGTFTSGASVTATVLVVAGGGGGGNGNGSAWESGGGGGGGVVYHSGKSLTAQGYTVTVGAGGAAATVGNDSVFSDITALGGGKGGTFSAGGSGGSGGGGAHNGQAGGSATQGTSGGGTGYGNAGGTPSTSARGGGGGGAGGAGGTLGLGGVGVANSISGSSVYYGGGGGAYNGLTGGNGGGGNGGSTSPSAGTANTGGGGGAYYGSSGNGGAGGSGVVIVSYPNTYSALTNTFTSAVMDLGAVASLTTIYVASTTSAGVTTVSVNARAGDTATPDGTWTSWSATSTVATTTISSLGSHRYVQYKANLATTDTTVTPTLDQVQIGYSQYSASGNLTSSKFNSESASNLISKLTWTATGTTTNETIKFQVRSSSDGNTWSNWCGPATACDGTDYFLDAHNGVSFASDHPLKNGGNDQWLQYKVFMASAGGATPALTSVTLTYVVNSPPNFDTSYGTNGVLPAQVSDSSSANWGKVTIGYSVRDTDTASGTVTPNVITPSFEYSTTSGTYWATIPNGDLSLGATTTKAVDASSYTTYTAVWTASSTLPDVYKTTMQVRVTASDSEAANATATATSGIFTLDTTAPVAGNGNVVLNATTTSAFVTLTVTDDSQNQYRICNDSAFPASDTQGNSCAWSTIATTTASTSVAWILPSSSGSAQTAYFQVRDVFGQRTAKTLTAPATPTNFLSADVSNPTASSYGEYLSWTTVSGASTYQIYYATTTGSTPSASAYTFLASTANNYYTHTITDNLTAKYWYKATAVSSNSDISTLTSAQGDVPDSYGTALPDTTAPTVSSIATSSVLSSSAVVTFTTNEIATSTVMYGSTQGACSSYGSSASTTAYSTAHSFSLTDLAPDTIYYFCIKAGDTTYNTSTATSTSGTGATLSLRTAPAAGTADTITFDAASGQTPTWCAGGASDCFSGWTHTTTASGSNRILIISVHSATSVTTLTYGGQALTQISSVTNNGVNLEMWYLLNPPTGSNTIVLKVSASGNLGAVASTYYNVSQSAPLDTATTNTGPNNANELDTTVTTGATTDLIVDAIGGAPTMAVVAGNSQNSRATGGGNGVGIGTSDKSGAASVTMKWNRGWGYASYIAVSMNPTYTTNPAVNIFHVASTSNSNSFTVTWDVSTSSNSYINYATSTAFNIPVTVGSATILASSTNHSVAITGLSASTGYYYSITSTDGSGNTTTDTNGGLYYGATTTAATTDAAPTFTSIATSSVLSTSAVVTIVTDKIATTSIAYGAKSGSCSYGSTATSTAFATSQSMTLSGLAAATTYCFRIQAANTTGYTSTATSTTQTGIPLEFTTDSAVAISSIATSSVNNTAFTVTWTTGTTSDSYVYYATSTAFTTSTSTGSASLTSAHSVNISGLTASTSYYFYVKSTDGSGNSTTDNNGGSYYNVVTTSNAAPVVSSIATSSVLSTSAVVTFTTDEIATSTVVYGTSQGACSSYSSSQSTTAYATSQSVSLTGLSAATTYYFCVKATDTSNVTSTATSTSGTGMTLAFTTGSAVAISSIATSSVNNTAFTVTWTTGTTSDSYVYYATSTAFTTSTSTGSASLTSAHSVNISGLTASTSYYFYVKSTDGSGNSTTDNNGGSYYNVVTTSNAAPVVSSIATSSVLSSSAVVTFTTDELATSSVSYGTSLVACDSYGTSQTTSSYATSQSVSLSNLSASTTYYFCVKATDTSGVTGTATSTTDTGLQLAFTTLSGPTISGVSAGSLTDTSAVISWTTASSSDSYVYYSTSQSLTNLLTVGSSTQALSHAVTLSDLTLGTAYYYYVKSTDSLGNISTDTNSPTGYYTISATRDVTAPTISNISAAVKSTTAAAIVWQTSENATSQVYYGTSSGSYTKNTSRDTTKSIYHVMTLASTTLNAAGGATDVAVSNNGLDSSATYYFVSVSTDNAGNTATSSESSFNTLSSDTDSTPPAVSSIAVPVATLKSSTATVTFTTDEIATSSVQYRVNGGSTWTTVNSTAYDVSHSVALSGLSENTTYNLQVRAGDASDNTSGYTAGSNFTTTGGPIVTSVTSGSLTDTSATISWNTSTSSDSYVYYATSSALTNPSTAGNATMVAASTTPGTYQHVVTLSGLTLNTRYYYYVKSTDANADSGTYPTSAPYNDFTTTIDTVGPVISAISAPVKSATAAVITWTTDELSSSQVEYGTASTTSGNYGATTVANTTPTIFHIVTLSSDTSKTSGGTNALVKNTAYYYRVKSLDLNSNQTISDQNTFTTNEDGAIVQTTVIAITTGGGGGGSSAPAVEIDKAPPAISDIKVKSVTPFGATVTFTTNEDAMGSVYYGETNNYGYNTGGLVWTRDHTITIKGLRMGTAYHFKVVANDKSGNTSTSEDQTLKTDMLAEDLGDLKILDSTSQEDIQSRIEELIESALPSLNPPYINTPEVLDIGEDSATVKWSTNVKSFGSIAYSEDANFADSSTSSPQASTASTNSPQVYTSEISESDSVKKTEHSIKITNLKSNTKYHFSIKSYVFQQATSKTEDLTFTTKASKVQAQALDRKNDSFRIVWNTDEETTSVVEYKRQGSAAGDKKSDETMTLYHDVLIDNLEPGTTYEIKVYGYNKDGNLVESKENLIVTTTRDVVPPVITSFKVDSALVPGRRDRTQTVVSWKTDEPSTSMVKYEEGSGSPDAPLSNKQEDTATLTTNHTVILTTLKPGTIYRFQIASVDQAGNGSKLPVRTIITPRQNESVVDVIFKNFEDTFRFVNNPR